MSSKNSAPSWVQKVSWLTFLLFKTATIRAPKTKEHAPPWKNTSVLQHLSSMRKRYAASSAHSNDEMLVNEKGIATQMDDYCCDACDTRVDMVRVLPATPDGLQTIITNWPQKNLSNPTANKSATAVKQPQHDTRKKTPR